MARLRVRELAEAKGMNISQLLLQANRLSPASSLSYPTVHALWHNKTKRPDLDTLTVIARALEVEPGELIIAGMVEEEDGEWITIPGLVAA
jgi:DNA-binding Xre family transcriptional regulator